MQNTLLVAVVALTVVNLLSLWGILYQLARQQGRLLLRLDEVEGRLGMFGGDCDEQEAPVVRGLEPGTLLPAFELPDLDGKIVRPAAFHGRPLLLVHWAPNCGYCETIAGELAALQPALQARDVQLALVSHGGISANRQLAEKVGLTCPILLPRRKGTAECFASTGTPAAYLVDAEGKVARPLALGADEVPALVREVAGKGQRRGLPGEKPLSESRVVRDGLKPGVPAPEFALPGVNGGTIRLEPYQGRRVLLVFSDPNCEPCDRLAPDLARLHREHLDNNLSVVLVGRGDVDENRRKAEEHGFAFPVGVQKHWELSKQYGIFATPAAFLIDEQGLIARKVAVGPDAILALASQK